MGAGRTEVRRRWAVAVAALGLLCFATAAKAAAPPLLVKVPGDGVAGAGAGRLAFPLGIAADPAAPGHVYVADFSNARIDEFSAWGEFVKAWGWGVRDGSAELQSCETECQKGKEGSGNGEFKEPEAVAVDGAGDVYVLEASNSRVQKFDPTGAGGGAEFLTKFGEAGTGKGQFGGGELAYRNKLAACPVGNSVYVGEGKRIQRFSSAGVPEQEIKLAENVEALAADSACHLYVAFQGKAEVEKIEGSSPEKVLAPAFAPEGSGEEPKGVAVDGHGNLYVGIRAHSGEPALVQKFDKEGHCLTCGSGGEGGKAGFDRSTETQLQSVGASSGCKSDGAYVLHFKPLPELAYFSAFGEPPNTTLCPQPEVAPEIDAQYALAVESQIAQIRAEINPRFWNNTTFRVEYGTSECKTGGCTTITAPIQLTTQTTSTPLQTPSVFLEGLKPGTTYHYRFLANTCFEPKASEPKACETGKEVEVKGVGGEVGHDGSEASFTTYAPAAVEACPANQAFRSGPSELLPDCRAYEMVSPLDKEGGDIRALPEFTTILPAVLSQSASSGDRMAFGSYRSFGGAASAPYTSEYVASREAGKGWATHAVVPPREQLLVIKATGFDTELRAFSPDLCEAWLGTYAEPALAPGTPVGFPNLYRRSDEECGGPAYVALNTAVPANIKGGPPIGLREVLRPELLGLSGDGATAVFAANDSLPGTSTLPPPQPKSCVEPEAGKEQRCQLQLYGSKNGEERFLCILPGGTETPFTGSCTAGGNTNGAAANRSTNVAGAVSADVSKVFWTASEDSPAPIYLRENPFGGGEECLTASSPCTIAVSQSAEGEAGTAASQFWAAAKDGSRALFVTGGRLYEFVLSEPTTPHLIAKEVLGTLGASEDASRVYLVSKEAKGGPNAEGKSATPGQANLYFYEAGQFHFIGALSGQDTGAGFSPIAITPRSHTARVAADGLSAAFMSTARLTGYDNSDQASGKADAEVFLYDASANGGAGKLVCASCNPGGARPAGHEFILPGFETGPWTAARIPVFENNLYASRVLSADGSRLFFDSQDALVPRDSNGKEDVYQWEAPGTGTCTTASSTYSPQDEGCIDLISSGQSKLNSEFLDASPSGDDVFFTTLSGLVPQDYGLVDVYDARVNGGLPSPPPAAIECEGETCQHPAAAPPSPTPPGVAYEGPGNLPPEKAKPPKCPKGKHRVTKNGKSSCVKNKKAKRGKRAGKSGRAQR